MSEEMRAVYDALLPPGAIWKPAPDGDFDKLLDGMGDNAQEVYEFLEALAHIRDPRQTTVLSDLEKEYGVLTNLTLSEADRREQLAGVKYVKPTTASFDHMQDNLRAAGFTGIIVTPNDPAIDPALITGDLIVNGPIYIEQEPAYIMQANGPYAFAGHGLAVAGYFLNIKRTAHVYALPAASEYWRFIFFVGGAASGWPGAPAIATYDVDYKRVQELTRLILKYKPTHSWAILVIDAIMIWTHQTAASAFIIYSGYYGAGVHLIVGSSGKLQTSPDGILWTDRINDGSYAGLFKDVVYDFNQFVAIGSGGEIQTSPDGIAWTAQTPAAAYAGTFEGIAYGVGVYAAVGSSGEIQTSPDGVNWTHRTPAGAYAGSFLDITFGNNQFVAVGQTGEIQTSQDGVTWTKQTQAGPFGGTFTGVIFGNNRFVAVGTTGEIQTSPDGVNWTARTPAGAYAGAFNQSIFGNNRFVIVGSTGEIQSSEDGVTWKAETQAGAYVGTFTGGHYGGNKFVIVGTSSEIQTS